jgi:hypothetical protein
MSTRKPFVALTLALVSALGCKQAVVPKTPASEPERPIEQEDDVVSPPPPVVRDEQPIDPALFLSRDGQNTRDDALRYYASLDRAEGMTVDKFREDIIGRDTVDALYRNTADLGFWREMSCSNTVDRDVGGCMVRNWRNAEETPRT